MIEIPQTVVSGLIATLVLTTVMRAASEFGLTRMDIPFLLGTAFSMDRTRAKAIGYSLHFLSGLIFAFLYKTVFVFTGLTGIVVGVLLGMLHALFVGTTLVNILLPLFHPRMGTRLTAASSSPMLEPPGFMMINYGINTPIIVLAAHGLYGALIAVLST